VKDARPAVLLVVALAALLRLPVLPGPLHPDEAAVVADVREGRWQASYARETDHGEVRDEGTYVWLAAPAIALGDGLGLPVEASARLPAALAGLALVVGTFALVRDLAGPRTAVLGALLVALEPWAVHASRLALRGVLVPPLVVWGLWSLGRRPWSSALSGGLLLAAAAATYPPARLVVPPLALAWVLALPGPRRPRLLALLPLGLVFAALLPWTLSSARLAQVWAPRGVGRGWILHYYTRFLWSGATSRGFAPEGVGLLLRVEAPLLCAGLVALAARRHARLLVWLALFPAAAALTTDAPNALRAVLGLPLLAIVGAVGAVALLRRLPPRALPVLLLVLAGDGLLAQARYRRDHLEGQARFYYAGRRELALALEREARGGALLVEAPFVRAYVESYAPHLARRSTGEGLVVGEGPVVGRARLVDDRGGAWTISAAAEPAGRR
jgi:4-amino-4-deoxy-L-arabinose transferase-like glycosyltransferase